MEFGCEYLPFNQQYKFRLAWEPMMEDGPMSKHDFLTKVYEARAIYAAALARVPAARREIRQQPGGWSVKDVLAHVVWSEREMIGLLRDRSMESGSDLWIVAQDERNRQVYEQNKDRPLSEVLAEADHTYAALVSLIEMLSDEDLNNPARFTGMPADWLPWRVLAGSTYKHYLEHADDLKLFM